MEWNSPAQPPLSAEELTAYVGPNAETYRAKFERFTRTAPPRFAFSWSWMAFLGGVWWYLYRKMYFWAVVDFALSVVFGWTLFVPLLWAVARAVTGDYLYFRQADRKIREFRSPSFADAPSANAAHLARLAREGGVLRWIPWAAVVGVILLLLFSALFFGILWKMFPPLHDLWHGARGNWV